MGGLTEYALAACTVVAEGTVGRLPAKMEGVEFCECVNFENPHKQVTRGEDMAIVSISGKEWRGWLDMSAIISCFSYSYSSS